MIEFTIHGDFKHVESFCEKILNNFGLGELDEYGKMGVQALSEATPRDTGLTASSWSYKIERKDHSTKIIWSNGNIQDGVNVAVVLQYGHISRDGYWVDGIDYINPALQPVFDQIAEKAWKEVNR